MVRVRFAGLVVSPVYGNCRPGDIVSCDESFARHVVEDLRCAAYVVPPAAAPEPAATPEPAVAGRRTRKRSV